MYLKFKISALRVNNILPPTFLKAYKVKTSIPLAISLSDFSTFYAQPPASPMPKPLPLVLDGLLNTVIYYVGDIGKSFACKKHQACDSMSCMGVLFVCCFVSNSSYHKKGFYALFILAFLKKNAKKYPAII